MKQKSLRPNAKINMKLQKLLVSKLPKVLPCLLLYLIKTGPPALDSLMCAWLLSRALSQFGSDSWRASAEGKVDPQGPWKWNLKRMVAGVSSVLNSATGTPLAAT